MVGIYGYSYTSFLVTAILFAIPVTALQWILLTYSAVTSAGFLAATFWKDLQSESNSLNVKQRAVVIGLMAAVQIGFLLLFKFYFFANVSY
jgi:hypothetical protein